MHNVDDDDRLFHSNNYRGYLTVRVNIPLAYFAIAEKQKRKKTFASFIA
jgi:hypothetical protein